MPCQLLVKRTLPAASFFYLCLCLLVAPLAADECRSDRIDETVHVSRVFDGDTVRLQDGRHLRLIGINTPELARDERPAQPLAEAARQRLRALLANNSPLQLRYGTERHDRYGRLLAHAFLADGRNLTALLLREGRGSQIAIPPNLWGLDCYRHAERVARAAGRGIWSHPWHQPRHADSLATSTRGFHLVTGRVSRIGESQRALWLNLGDGFAVRIPREDLVYFKKIPPPSLLNRKIEVRGWIYRRNRQLRLTLQHPAGLRILD